MCWIHPKLLWKLTSGGNQYIFQLPESIGKQWLDNVTNEFELRKEAINCKERLLSSMIVYYLENGYPAIKMISIDRSKLEEAKARLR